MKDEYAKYFVRLGEHIRTLRFKKGIDQKQLAFESGVSRTVLHTIEKGTANPSARTLLKLAAALDVSIAELMDV